MSLPASDDFVPRRHPASRRIVAVLVIFALVLSAVAVGVAIAQAHLGSPSGPTQEQEEPVVPA